MTTEVNDPDEKLREWAEENGVWNMESINAQRETDDFVSTALRQVAKPKHEDSVQASGVAGIICAIGWCSVFAFPLLFALVGLFTKYTAGSVILGLMFSAIAGIPGLMMVGFGLIVENLTRIEQHLRNKR